MPKQAQRARVVVACNMSDRDAIELVNALRKCFPKMDCEAVLLRPQLRWIVRVWSTTKTSTRWGAEPSRVSIFVRGFISHPGKEYQ